MRETEMSKRGIGYVAANGSSIENYGEKKIVGYTDDGESLSMRVHCADVKKALCSVHKMNLGGNVVALDGGASYTQNKANSQKTRINCEEGQHHAPAVAGKGGGGAGGDGGSSERQWFRDPGRGK